MRRVVEGDCLWSSARVGYVVEGATTPWSWASLPGLRRFESETIAIGGSVQRGHVVTCYGAIAEWKTSLVRDGLWR